MAVWRLATSHSDLQSPQPIGVKPFHSTLIDIIIPLVAVLIVVIVILGIALHSARDPRQQGCHHGHAPKHHMQVEGSAVDLVKSLDRGAEVSIGPRTDDANFQSAVVEAPAADAAQAKVPEPESKAVTFNVVEAKAARAASTDVDAAAVSVAEYKAADEDSAEGKAKMKPAAGAIAAVVTEGIHSDNLPVKVGSVYSAPVEAIVVNGTSIEATEQYVAEVESISGQSDGAYEASKPMVVERVPARTDTETERNQLRAAELRAKLLDKKIVRDLLRSNSGTRPTLGAYIMERSEVKLPSAKAVEPNRVAQQLQIMAPEMAPVENSVATVSSLRAPPRQANTDEGNGIQVTVVDATDSGSYMETALSAFDSDASPIQGPYDGYRFHHIAEKAEEIYPFLKESQPLPGKDIMVSVARPLSSRDPTLRQQQYRAMMGYLPEPVSHSTSHSHPLKLGDHRSECDVREGTFKPVQKKEVVSTENQNAGILWPLVGAGSSTAYPVPSTSKSLTVPSKSPSAIANPNNPVVKMSGGAQHASPHPKGEAIRVVDSGYLARTTKTGAYGNSVRVTKTGAVTNRGKQKGKQTKNTSTPSVYHPTRNIPVQTGRDWVTLDSRSHRGPNVIMGLPAPSVSCTDMVFHQPRPEVAMNPYAVPFQPGAMVPSYPGMYFLDGILSSGVFRDDIKLKDAVDTAIIARVPVYAKQFWSEVPLTMFPRVGQSPGWILEDSDARMARVRNYFRRTVDHRTRTCGLEQIAIIATGPVSDWSEVRRLISSHKHDRYGMIIPLILDGGPYLVLAVSPGAPAFGQKSIIALDNTWLQSAEVHQDGDVLQELRISLRNGLSIPANNVSMELCRNVVRPEKTCYWDRFIDLFLASCAFGPAVADTHGRLFVESPVGRMEDLSRGQRRALDTKDYTKVPSIDHMFGWGTSAADSSGTSGFRLASGQKLD